MGWKLVKTTPGTWGYCATTGEGEFLLMTDCDGNDLRGIVVADKHDVMVGYYYNEDAWRRGDDCMGVETFRSVLDGFKFLKMR